MIMNIKQKIYWFCPLLLFLLQLIYTQNSFTQIRYEELAESVRNVYWFQNHTIYDGVSTNIGWQIVLLFVYNIFGFTLNTAKYVRLAIQLVSLFCLAAVLKKYLGEKKAWIPLIIIGLSPTLLFYNSLSVYGFELQYFPIIIYLITSLNIKKKKQFLLKEMCLGIISMIAAMTYPSFIFYLPSAFLLYIWILLKQLKNEPHKNISVLLINLFFTLFFFLLPLVLAFLFLKDRSMLFYDPIAKSGIFRGAGKMHPDINVFFQNIKNLLTDLFVSGISYYYEVYKPDFSDIYPIFTILFVIVISAVLFFKVKRYRFILTLVWISLLINLIVANNTYDPNTILGMRRNTGILVAIYVLIIVVWDFINRIRWTNQSLKIILISVLLLIPLHHIIVYPINYAHLTDLSPYRSGLWFSIGSTPENSVSMLVQNNTKQDLKLACKDNEGNVAYCRYPEIYASVAGSCLWNRQTCKNILGYDNKTKTFVPLSIDLWEKYYWEH